MKELLKQLATYNYWANKKMTDAILNLDAALYTKEVKSSFTSLQATILHMLNAESIWWQRLKLQERITVPSENFTEGMEQAVKQLLNQNKVWEEWIQSTTDAGLEHVFAYQNSKKEQFKQPVYQMLLHLFNHGTYHRGQLVTILRALEIEKIPSTDFIVWSRKGR